MKKVLFALIIGLMTLSIQQPGGYAADEKFAFVNIEKLFDEYEKTKDNDKVLQEAGKEKEEERNVIVDDIRKMKDELELLGDEAKKEKQEEMNARVRELQDFDLKARQELGQKRQEIVQVIFGDIDKAVAEYGKQKNIDFILNDRALVYFNDKYDVTSDILKTLNEDYK